MLVTTSYGATQAYQDIKEDGHPIIIICAADIVQLLKNAGIAAESDVAVWLTGF